jgi:hypothetical protein
LQKTLTAQKYLFIIHQKNKDYYFNNNSFDKFLSSIQTDSQYFHLSLIPTYLTIRSSDLPFIDFKYSMIVFEQIMFNVDQFGLHKNLIVLIFSNP